MREQRHEYLSTTKARRAFLSLSLTQLAAQKHEFFLEMETIVAMKRELASTGLIPAKRWGRFVVDCRPGWTNRNWNAALQRRTAFPGNCPAGRRNPPAPNKPNCE